MNLLKFLWKRLNNEVGGGTGSSSQTSVYTPTPAPAPTTAQSMQDWVANNPAVLAEQMRSSEVQAQNYMDLYNQYALPIAQADYNANAALYPETAKLQETMAGQAAEGMTSTDMPDWMKKNMQSDYNANLGTNAGSPIGADYVSRGMQEQLFNQQKYYRDLGLSLAGRQPLSSAQSPNTSSGATDYTSTFTPGSVMNYTQQGYASNSQAARPIGLSESKSSQSPLWGLLGSNI
jgi:hypothetical protein